MRVLYPDIVFGSISSSGVTHATVVDWRYFDIIRQYAPQDCVARIEKTVDEVDALLTRNNSTRNAIKAAFGLSGVSYDPDFASLLTVRRGHCILAQSMKEERADERSVEPARLVAEQELGSCY